MKKEKTLTERIYQKAEAEIMDNIYELIRVNFDAIIVADAIQIVGKPLRKALSQAQKEILEELLEPLELKELSEADWEYVNNERQKNIEKLKKGI